jgi:UrcA family protein
MHRSSIAVVALIAALSSVPAAAETASVRVIGNAPNAHGVNQLLATTVQYGDLDISTSGGVATLLGRIETASLSVCGVNSTVAAQFADKIATCRKRAVAAAVQLVDAPLVTQAAATR